MESTVRLFNTALGRLGGDQCPLNISSLETDTAGKLCQMFLPHILDVALDSHPWSFALKRVHLAELTALDPSNADYRYRYRLPSDCVRPVRVEGFGGINRTLAYSIEEDTVMSDAQDAVLLYVSRVSLPKLWPARFADALAWKLAAELSTSRNNDVQRQQLCEQMYEMTLSRAIVADKARQNPKQRISAWQAARGNVCVHYNRAERY